MSKEQTWSVTYKGFILANLINDTILIPIEFDQKEADRLGAIGYVVSEVRDHPLFNGRSVVIIDRPK